MIEGDSSKPKQYREREIFQLALRIPEGDNRKRFLENACEQAGVSTDRIHQLLNARLSSSNILHQVVSEDVTQPSASDRDCAPNDSEGIGLAEHPLIGPYKILEKLGQGGMGTVYMAEQTAPLRRTVALKVIKAGMDTAEVIARFEAERQALAMMDHPNIAKVLDGGTTEAGRPYFVMELVRGKPITRFCLKNKLSLRERLQLFIAVCRGVQHAHQKGIIHRDIKPSNLLVTMHDHLPMVKIIDFGVAKALTEQLTDKTQFTHFAQLVGTPLYMSPEQAQLSGLDADTRSDTYSLGVVLYELLTGTTPVRRDSFSGLNVEEIRKLICEKEPPPPSARLSTLETSADTTISKELHSPEIGISGPLPRELDWIVMKAIQKDRTLRYESTIDLARDIERFLNNEPVLARAPSWRYRTQKAIARNRGILTVTTAIFLALLLGLGLAAWQAVSANRARNLAEKRAVILTQKNAELFETTNIANKARRDVEELLYAVEINLASDALLSHDMPRVNNLLSRHKDRNFDGTVPFELLYLQQAVHAEAAWTLSNQGDILFSRLSPNGRMLGFVTREGSLSILSARTGELLARTTVVFGLNSFAWAPDSKHIACGSGDGSVRLFEFHHADKTKDRVAAVEQVGKLGQVRDIIADTVRNGSVAEVTSAIFSKDGETLISGTEDGNVRFWNLGSRQCEAEMKEHSRSVEQLALSPDGNYLATASSDETFQIWDLKTRKPIIQRKMAGRAVCVAFSSDAQLCAAGSVGGEIKTLHLASGKTSTYKSLDGIESLSFLGRKLVAGDRAGTVHLLNIQLSDAEHPGLSFETSWVAHSGRVSSLQRAVLGGVISSSRSGQVSLWSSTPRVPVGRLPNVFSFDFQGEDSLILGLQQLLEVSLGQKQIISRHLPREEPWEFVSAAQDSPRIALANTKQILVIDLRTHEVLAMWPTNDQLHRLALSPDGQWLAAASYGQDGVLLRSVDAPDKEKRLAALSSRALCFSPDSTKLAVGNLDDCFVYDIKDDSDAPSNPTRLLFHDSTLTTISFSPDGRRLVTGSDDRRIGLWDVDTGELQTTITAHPARVECASFSADGKRIVTCSASGHIRVWHASTLQPLLQIFLDVDSSVRKIAFSPDQTHLGLATGSALYLIHSGSPPNGSINAYGDTLANTSIPNTRLWQLGDLPGGMFQSLATGISNDGQTVVGQSTVEEGFRPFVWNEAKGLRQRGAPDNSLNGEINCVTNDGLVSGGAGATRDEGGYSARLWFPEGRTQRLSKGKGAVTDLSSDGKVAVLHSKKKNGYASLVWRDGSTQELPPAKTRTTLGNQALAIRCTGNGSVILGNQFALPAGKIGKDYWKSCLPVRWRSGNPEVVTNLAPEWNWIANDFSDNGQVIIGSCLPPSSSVDDPGSRMFICSEDTLQIINPPKGFLEICPRAISGDGKTIVGRIGRPLDSYAGGRAFIWRLEFGIQDLNSCLGESVGELDFSLVDAFAVSEDGSFIAGYGEHADGRLEGYRVELRKAENSPQ